MNPALRKCAAKITTAVNDNRGSTIKFYYELGQILIQVSEQRDTYGENARDLLADAFAVQLRTMRFAETFASMYADGPGAILELYDEASGFSITWGHIRILTSVPSKPQRTALAAKAFKQRWTPKELQDYIKKSTGREAGHGRPHKMPIRWQQHVAQISGEAEKFQAKVEKVWTDGQQGLLKQLEAVEMVDDADMAKLTDLRGTLEIFTADVTALAKQVEDAIEVANNKAAELTGAA